MKEPIKSFCLSCKININYAVLHVENQDVMRADQESPYYDFFGHSYEYQIIQCRGCNAISFKSTYKIKEFNIHGNEAFNGTRVIRNMPIPINGGENHFFRKDFHNLPKNIDLVYTETVDAFNLGSYILCCAGLRTLIEGICIDKDIKGISFVKRNGESALRTNLQGKIDGLCEGGYLTSQNADSLHELRFLGNEAVHELSKPSMSESRIALEIIDLTISNIYGLQHKTEDLKNKKSLRTGKK